MSVTFEIMRSSLTERPGRGDRDAFSALYERYIDAAWGVAVAVTQDPEEARVAVSEAFIRVREALQSGSLNSNRPFKPYLLATVRNAAQDVLRREGRPEPSGGEAGIEPWEPGVATFGSFRARLEGNSAAAVFSTLPEAARTVLWLTEVEGMAVPEAGQVLRKGVKATSELASQARARLRQGYLQQHLLTPLTKDCWTPDSLEASLQQSLPETEMAKLEKHVSSCRDCFARLKDVQELGNKIRLSLVPLTASLSERIREEWEQAGEWVETPPRGTLQSQDGPVEPSGDIEKEADDTLAGPLADIEPEQSLAGPLADIDPEQSLAGPLADIEPEQSLAGPLADIEPEPSLAEPVTDSETDESMAGPVGDPAPEQIRDGVEHPAEMETEHKQGPLRLLGDLANRAIHTDVGPGIKSKWAGLVAMVVSLGLAGVLLMPKSSAPPLPEKRVERPPASAASEPVNTTPVVSPGEAKKVVDEFEGKMVKAYAAMDAAMSDSLQAGPMGEVADAFFQSQSALGKKSLQIKREFSVDEVSVYVPRQTEYPAQFLAAMPGRGGRGSGASALALFQKESADSPFKLTVSAVLPGNAVPALAVDPEGFADLVTDADGTKFKVLPAGLPQEFASYLESFASAGPSPVFAPGRNTTKALESLRNSVAKSAASGVSQKHSFSPGQFRVFTYRTTAGGALALFTVNQTTTLTSTSARPLTANIRQSGGYVPTGRYSRIEHRMILMRAAVVPPHGAPELVDIVGAHDGKIASSAVKAGSE